VQYTKPFPGISTELSRMFMEFDWPGNVRQLENLIKRMVVLGSEAPIVHELRQPATLHQWRTQLSVGSASDQSAVAAGYASTGRDGNRRASSGGRQRACPPVGIDLGRHSRRVRRREYRQRQWQRLIEGLARSAAREAERE
jgi:transcriptional regulator with PAS, ATPase and Fis domain